MINLGVFATKEGRSYDCHFIPEDNLVQAVGPLAERVGSRGVVFEAFAASEEEARKIIVDAIKQGNLK